MFPDVLSREFGYVEIYRGKIAAQHDLDVRIVNGRLELLSSTSSAATRRILMSRLLLSRRL
jgi:hypothetical protein